MTPQAFAAAYRDTAEIVSLGTGLDPVVLLAQWACETDWGNVVVGSNLGNIRCSPTSFCRYASLDDFAIACVATFHNGYYPGVLAAKTADAQLAAIIASPWDAGHYSGSLAAFYNPLEDFEMTPQEHGWLQDLHASQFPESADQPPARNYLNQRLDAITAAIKAIPAGGGGAPVDLSPILSAVANVETAVLAVQGSVSAIKTKTDKDLA